MNRHLSSVIDTAQRLLRGQKAVEQRNIEYWSKREPYRSSGRAFGHIELINPVTTKTGLALAVRGWIFDKESHLSNLRIMIPRSDVGTTISNLHRHDVVVNMRRFRHSLASGFVSLIPIKEPPTELALGASYKVDKEQINVVFENTPISLGIALPGELVGASSTVLPKENGLLALVLLPDWTPEPAVITSIIERYSTPQTTLAVFSTLSTQQLNKLSGSPMWHTRIEVGINDIAGTLLQRGTNLRQIVVTGAVASDIVQTQLLTLLAHAPTPPISWFVPTNGDLSPPNLPPLSFRGNLIEWVYTHSP
jgi:hypothetical protein